MVSLKNIQTEIDASFLYGVLADNEQDENVKSVFRQMSEIEQGHALAFMAKKGVHESKLPTPSTRAKILHSIGKIFGYDYILGVLLDTEKSISTSVIHARRQSKTASSISDTAHVAILKNILDNNPNISGSTLTRFEKDTGLWAVTHSGQPYWEEMTDWYPISVWLWALQVL